MRGAARMAIGCGDTYIDFLGEEAVARWFARCERILEDLKPSPEHGWLAALQSAVALGSGDAAIARRLGEQARELGRAWQSHGSRDGGAEPEGLALGSEGAVFFSYAAQGRDTL